MVDPWVIWLYLIGIGAACCIVVAIVLGLLNISMRYLRNKIGVKDG